MTAQNALGQPIGDPVSGWVPPLPPARQVLQGRYCRLEPLDAHRHAASLHAASALDVDHRNWTYLAYGPWASLDAYATWVAQMAASDDPLFYAVVVPGSKSEPEFEPEFEPKSASEAVGVASYLRIMPASGSIEVGHINFSPRLQHTQAATESMYLMMRHAFQLGYRRYEWKCDALNAPSRAAAQRLGFSYEGIFRQATVYKGRSRDTAWFASIDQEWPALEAAFEQWLAAANFDAHGRQRVSLSSLTAPILVASADRTSLRNT